MINSSDKSNVGGQKNGTMNANVKAHKLDFFVSFLFYHNRSYITKGNKEKGNMMQMIRRGGLGNIINEGTRVDRQLSNLA